MARITLASLGRQLSDLWTERGRLDVRIARVVGTAASRTDDIEAWATKYAPDTVQFSGSLSTIGEYARAGRVVITLDELKIDPSDVSLSTLGQAHKVFGPKVKDPKATLQSVWKKASGRKGYPTYHSMKEALVAAGIEGAKGPKSGSSGARNVGTANARRSGKSQTVRAAAKPEPAEINFSDKDRRKVTEDLNKVFAAIPNVTDKLDLAKICQRVCQMCVDFGAANVNAVMLAKVTEFTPPKPKSKGKTTAQKRQTAQTGRATRRPRTTKVAA